MMFEIGIAGSLPKPACYGRAWKLSGDEPAAAVT